MTEYTPQLATEHHQPNYLLIFIVLALVTVVEVTVFASVPLVLVLLSLAKVVLVAMYYMHLRYDSPWYTAIFMFPLPFVLLVTTVVFVAVLPATNPDGSVAAQAVTVCSFF